MSDWDSKELGQLIFGLAFDRGVYSTFLVPLTRRERHVAFSRAFHRPILPSVFMRWGYRCLSC